MSLILKIWKEFEEAQKYFRELELELESAIVQPIKRKINETLAQCADCSLFVVDYFSP